MIDRYCLPGMKAIWDESHKFASWLAVEIAVCKAQESCGNIPAGTTEKILAARAEAQEKGGDLFTIQRIEEIERETHHDLIAFVKCVQENLASEDGMWLHYGVTSFDIEDTAAALRLQDSANIIIEDLLALSSTIKALACAHQHTPMIGRTHGVQAEPITFGFKMAVWHSQIQRDLKRMVGARDAISVGKISGAVGINGNVDPEIEECVCKELELRPALISTQIIQRDRIAQFMTTLAIIASSCENYATEMRNLQRTEILEVQEMFLPGQRGSSAMPHKRNPWRFETICGLARNVRANALPAMENIVSWHERDLTNSSCERIIIPDSCFMVDFMLQSLNSLMGKLEIKAENMQQNLEKMGKLVFSEHVMQALINKGLTRDEAYKLVQRNCAKVWDDQIDFRLALGQDPEVSSLLSAAELDQCLDLDHHLRNVDRIFARLHLNA